MLVIILAALSWLLTAGIIYLRTKKKQDIMTAPTAVLFFTCKIVAGCLYGYMFKKIYGGDDTWGLNNDAWLQYHRLLRAPVAFFSDLFSNHPIPPEPEYYFHPATYFESLEYSFFTKLMAPFNLFSQGNYYINTIFFNFLCWWGIYLFCRLLVKEYKVNNKILIAAIFLFPPTAFWLSGIRAEGLLLLFTGMLLYHFNQWLNRSRLLNMATCLLAFAVLFLMRNGYALLLIPALTAWWMVKRFNQKPAKAFILVYAVIIVFTIAGGYILPDSLNPLSLITRQQHSFLLLNGNSRLPLTPLEGNAVSFLKVLPQAVVNVFLRPFVWESKGALQWLMAFENLAIVAIVLFTIIKTSKRSAGLFHHPLAWVLLAIIITNYLFIGYTVPFSGAIIRYRIIPELFLLTLCLMSLALKEKSGQGQGQEWESGAGSRSLSTSDS